MPYVPQCKLEDFGPRPERPDPKDAGGVTGSSLEDSDPASLLAPSISRGAPGPSVLFPTPAHMTCSNKPGQETLTKGMDTGHARQCRHEEGRPLFLTGSFLSCVYTCNLASHTFIEHLFESMLSQS